MNVLELRRKLNLTQRQLAERIGVSHVAVGHWERNEREPCRMARKLLAQLQTEKKLPSPVDNSGNVVTF